MLLDQAYRLHRDGKALAACKAYEAFLAKFPRHGEALGNFGFLLHSQGQQARAVALYEQALEFSPRLHHLYSSLGTALRELGRPQEAVAAYEKALGQADNQADILLHLGLAHGDAGHFAQARACFDTLLEDNPENSQASYHLGLLFFQEEQFAAAVTCFSTVLAAYPDYVDACFNLALCHKALGHTVLALDFLGQAAELAPHDADILYNIGVIHKDEGQMAEAEATFLQALEIDPTNGICLTDLAILYHNEDRLAEAKAMYQRALACGYQADSARHMLAALHGQTTAASPLQHIRDLFNNYARGFDQSLIHDLQYSVPAQLAESFHALTGGTVLSAGLDLGCGTGLAGHVFRRYVHHLTGVDLSENMLSLAAAKELYDELHGGGIIEFLHEQQRFYDLALATDVFVYLGELEAFFRVMARVLNPAGFLLFSVESCDAEYCLRQSGRYAHSPGYIGHLADTYHFTIAHQQSTGIRKERGEWIPGELYIMQRS